MKKQIEMIYSLVLKDGLRQTKFKNSHLKPVSSAEEEGNKDCSIFQQTTFAGDRCSGKYIWKRIF